MSPMVRRPPGLELALPGYLRQGPVAGKSAYEKWMQSPVHAHHLMRQEFMAKLYFTYLEGVSHARSLVDAQRAACQKWLESLSAKAVEPQTFKRFLCQYRIGQIKAEIAWLENDLREL